MKELVYAYWKLILITLIIASGISFPMDVNAETCPFGQASLNASTQFMRFTQTAKNCKNAKKETKRITFTVSGEEAISVYSTDLHSGDDKESERAFKIRNTLSYGLRPGDSNESDIIFQPSESRSYSSTLVVTFGFANESLGPYRECLVRTHGAEISRKRELLEQFRQKGVDLSVPNQREQKLRSDFADLKTKLTEERINADRDKFKFEMEKEAALEDLRKGLFCDQCHWSKTRIENEKHEKFEDHLKRVRGNVEPAPQKVIDETIDFYNAKINEAKDRSEKAAKKLDESTTKNTADLLAVEKMKQQLIEAFNNAIALLKRGLEDAQKRSNEAMALWERKRQKREVLNISIEGECREE